MKPVPALIAAALALSGCATVDSLQSSAVDEQVQSAKPLAELSLCLQRAYGAAPIADEQGRQVFIYKNAWGDPLSTLTLTPNDQGVLLQERRTGLSVTGVWKKCV